MFTLRTKLPLTRIWDISNMVHTYVNPEKGLNGPPGTASVRYLRSVTGKRIGGNLTLHLVHLVVQEKAKFRTWFRRVVKRPV